MKIYAITRGHYSSYEICALTVSKEKAEKLRKLYSDNWYDANIEEFEDGDDEHLRLCWNVVDAGKKITVSPEVCSEREIIFKDNVTGRVTGAFVYGKDTEHAIKRYYDLVAEYKAKQAGL